MIAVWKVILLPLKGIILWVTFSKVPRYGIMAIISSLSWNHSPSPQAWNCCVPNWIPVICSSNPPEVCLTSQLKRWFMSHSVSCLSVARSSRRSILLEFSLPSRCYVGRSSQSKDVKIDIMQWINIPGKGSWIEKIVIVLWPPSFLPHVLNLGTRFLFSGGELSQP